MKFGLTRVSRPRRSEKFDVRVHSLIDKLHDVTLIVLKEFERLVV
jgi:hypothetical protein